ncbi:MAG: hypothetical protein LJE95_09305 [Acidobacteria bacterium]|jgi:hypothetical protein|nr:hypothetical protein [Acidobacteriota bacterium]
MRRPGLAIVLLLVLIAGGWMAVVTAAQQEPDLAAAEQHMTAFINAVVVFTKGVHLDEKRLQNVLANMDSLNRLDNDGNGDKLADRAFSEGRYDFNIIIKDPKYAGWCKQHGLDPTSFFKDLMRLETLIMQTQVTQQLDAARAQMPAQRKQLEAMKDKIGEPAYKQALASFDRGMASLERTAKQIQRIPPATDVETSLLAKYGSQIATAMGDQEGDATQ